MPLLLILLELYVGILAVWVVAFQFALYRRVPIETLGIAFSLLVIIFLTAMARTWMKRVRLSGCGSRRFARNILAVGCLVGIFVLTVSRPDADDVGYFHQAMVDAATPSGPFTVDPFYYPFQGERIVVPMISENEAFEAMVVVCANALHVEPLQFYHNVFAFFSTIVWVLTYTLLFRQFRVPQDKLWLALLAILIFLLIDGNLHRSVGNFNLLRIWQGKIVAFAILGPAFMLFSLRFLARPGMYRFGLVCATGAVSFFINRSSVFVVAVLGAAIAISYFFVSLGSRRRRVRSLMLAAAVTPMWALGVCVAFISLPSDSSVSSVVLDIFSGRHLRPDQPTWWASLYTMVIGSPLVLLRDLLYLTVLPFLVLRPPLHRLLPLLSLSVAALALSPFTGPVWFYLVGIVYWRLYYALPLLLSAGLVVFLMFPSPLSRRSRVTRVLFGAVLLGTTGLAIERPTLSRANQVELKHPFEYRFRHEALTFARSVAPRLGGKLVLAPEEISVILALTEFDSINLVYIRASSPSSRVNRAASAVSLCHVNTRSVDSLGHLLSRGVDAMVMSSCNETAMRRLRRLLPDYRLEEDISVAAPSFHLFWVRPNPRAAQP